VRLLLCCGASPDPLVRWVTITAAHVQAEGLVVMMLLHDKGGRGAFMTRALADSTLGPSTNKARSTGLPGRLRGKAVGLCWSHARAKTERFLRAPWWTH
jgi:hypothetical protein